MIYPLDSILWTWVVSKKILASMTSTASLASKNQKQHTVCILSDFHGIRHLSASMTSTASVAHFIKKNLELDVSIKSGTKIRYPVLLMWDGATQNSQTSLKPNLACVFLSVRANWNINVCPWTPCRVWNPPTVVNGKIKCSIHLYSSPCIGVPSLEYFFILFPPKISTQKYK